VSGDLAAFYGARLDEDEAAAKACESPSPWKAADHESDTWIVTDADGDPLIYDEGTPSLAEAAHIACHDPARVLREVAAGRKLLAAYQAVVEECHTMELKVDRRPRKYGEHDGLHLAIRIRAAVYSDCKGYRQEWKP